MATDDPAPGALIVPMPVRFADADSQGVVYFANYLTYFDEALMAWFARAGLPWADLADSGVDMVYVDARSQYRAGSAYGDVLEIEVGVEAFGTTSTTWLFRVRGPGGGAVRVEGRLVSVFVDRATRRPVVVPDQLRRAGPA